MMHRFVTRQNISHFQGMLWSEIDRETRFSVHRLLVEEEDKLAKDLELLSLIEQHIADGDRRIEQQAKCVNEMRLSGRDGMAQAQALLDGMLESRTLIESYRCLVASEVDRNKIVDW